MTPDANTRRDDLQGDGLLGPPVMEGKYPLVAQRHSGPEKDEPQCQTPQCLRCVSHWLDSVHSDTEGVYELVCSNTSEVLTLLFLQSNILHVANIKRQRSFIYTSELKNVCISS